MPCRVGAGRMRAPLALEANGGSALGHRCDEANIRLRVDCVNRICVVDTRRTIA
jgi:hypothetical protein